jgi:hypothetical protein
VGLVPTLFAPPPLGWWRWRSSGEARLRVRPLCGPGRGARRRRGARVFSDSRIGLLEARAAGGGGARARVCVNARARPFVCAWLVVVAVTVRKCDCVEW